MNSNKVFDTEALRQHIHARSCYKLNMSIIDKHHTIPLRKLSTHELYIKAHHLVI